MKDWLLEHKYYLAAAMLIAIGGYFLYNNNPVTPDPGQALGMEQKLEKVQNHEADPLSKEKSADAKEKEIIMVDIKGQVKMPGVYKADEGERIIDLISRAGGLTELADQTQVNFAEHVVDAMVIYIPAIGEAGNVGAGPNGGQPMQVAGGPSQGQGKINLNKADEGELQKLPGIGPAKAAAIIEYRSTSGPFKTVEDLKNVSGIGEKTFEKLKDLVIVK